MDLKPDCIIVTCFGRWRFLEHTLKATLVRTPDDVRIYVVSSDQCPDETPKRLQDYDSRVSVVRVQFDRAGGKVIFNKPRAINAGIRACREKGHAVALLMDADTILRLGSYCKLGIDVSEDLKSFQFAFIETRLSTRDLTGVLVASIRRLTSVGGMDERMQGWGAEDLDLRLRLHAFSTKDTYRMLDPSLFVAVAHSDELRVANYGSDLVSSLHANTLLMQANYEKRTGKSLAADWTSSAITDLLGYEVFLESMGLQIKS